MEATVSSPIEVEYGFSVISGSLQAFNHKEILYMQFGTVYQSSYSETLKKNSVTLFEL